MTPEEAARNQLAERVAKELDPDMWDEYIVQADDLMEVVLSDVSLLMTALGAEEERAVIASHQRKGEWAPILRRWVTPWKEITK